jgi:hypothetical protein
MNFNNTKTKGLLILLFLFFGITQAQKGFHPGLRGGANFSHFTKDSDYYNDPYDSNSERSALRYDTKTDFYLGFYGAIKLTKVYTLQPEIDYSSQGTNYRSAEGYNTNLSVDYLSFEVLNKFTFGDRFNVHVGPTLDFVVDKNFRTETNFDMAFVLGAGINITHNFAIEGRVKKGIIPVLDLGNYHTNVVFSLGATYTFDVK